MLVGKQRSGIRFKERSGHSMRIPSQIYPPPTRRVPNAGSTLIGSARNFMHARGSYGVVAR